MEKLIHPATYWSPTCGALISQNADQISSTFVSENPPPEHLQHHLLTLADDWEEIAVKGELPLERLQNDFWSLRASKLIAGVLDSASSQLELDALDCIEELLQTRPIRDAIISRLLIAPLLFPKNCERLSEIAATNGFGAASELLGEIASLQPQINRFCSIWLSLPPETTTTKTLSRSGIWVLLTSTGRLHGLLNASSRDQFLSIWIQFLDSTPASDRKELARLGNELVSQIFSPAPKRTRQLTADAIETIEDDKSHRPGEPGHDRWLRAMKQVNAIAEAVSEGKDTNAYKYLQDLIGEQVHDGSPEYVTKSLCNIAKRCADMFRADFESECLHAATRINPNDPWTMIQLGDHYKRIRNYDKAIAILEESVKLQYDPVAIATIADVWSCRGNADKAFAIYRSIENWENEESVLTAMADLNRRRGDLGIAEKQYSILVERWNSHRAQAGIADIHKRRCQFGDALEIYNGLLGRRDLDDGDRFYAVYKLARCQVLKLMGRFESAFKDADSISRKYPFMLSAKIQAGSILGLQGKADAGLLRIPAAKSGIPTGFGEWMRSYVRGLLLLRQERYSEARDLLVRGIARETFFGEERSLMRLSAAFAFITQDRFVEAGRLIDTIPTEPNPLVNYITHVLHYHVATRTLNEALIHSLRKKIFESRLPITAVEHIDRREPKSAIKSELQLLLSLV